MLVQRLRHGIIYRVRSLQVLVFFLLIGCVGYGILALAVPIRAASAPSFNFTIYSSGNQMYGEQMAEDEYRYVFEATVSDDVAILDAFELEIDSEGRQDLSDNSTTGPLDTNIESFRFVFDQVPYADSLPHTINFCAINNLAEETCEQFTFQIDPDIDDPYFTFDQSASGTVNTSTLDYAFTATDDYFVHTVSGYIDAPINSFLVTKDSGVASSWLTNMSVDISGYMDGNAHTVYFVATDPYGNTGTESF
ncbi:hypothetical protein KBD71_02895, partial [Candidatus Woesebacteria bacterium]|nr:hypothetical protein [Candidatus Woesebacteria bacterium]